jgi:hypothetical protein
MSPTALTFLPWVRQGAASVVTTPDSASPAKLIDARVELTVALGLNVGAPDGGAQATARLRLYGPGDVQGLDTRQVIRTEPAPDATDFESNYFPFIEFDRPDLPWVFTPAAHDGSHRLRPWLCLVVVPEDKASVLADPTRPLPYLRIATAAGTELPDLSESWAWAHAQVAGGDAGDALDSQPEHTLSRLVCPRQLDGKTRYIAAVVPAFDVGVAAGLGQKLDDTTIPKLKPAWDAATAAIDLPVYYHWEFATGDRGDFEDLVTRLRRIPGDQADGLGTRAVRIVDAGGGLPDLLDAAGQPAPAGFGGALRPVRDSPAAPPAGPSYPAEFTEALRGLVSFPDTPAPGQVLPPGLVVPPPLYGRWHAAQSSIAAAPVAAGVRDVQWLRELNLGPDFRSAAALGTRIVRERQEDLMASAWAQAGAVEKANQLLRQAQLARDSARTRFAGLIALADAEKVIVAGPALSRVLVDPDPQNPDPMTARARFERSRVPLAMTQGPFRRAARSRGPVARRITAAGGDGSPLAARLLVRANSVTSLVPARANPSGMVGIQHALESTFGAGLRPKLCEITPRAIKNRMRTLPAISPALNAFFEAALAHQARMARCPSSEPPASRQLDLTAIATALKLRLDPEKTVLALMSSLVTAPGWTPGDGLAPVMAAPEFPAPMYRALAALSAEHLLPGLEHLPSNSITAVETNRAFIAAFMVGLNHEMSRELLWREYPTDQRGTYFRQFWDPSARVPPPSAPAQIEAARDIDPLHQWPTGTALEKSARATAPPGGAEQTVLVIRGDLIRRYANATVYAARAEWYDAAAAAAGPKTWRRRPILAAPESNERYPAFQGSLPPDVTFMGFALPPAEARGRQVDQQGNPVDDSGAEIADPVADDKAGWFVVFQQHPTEPRFGLDETGTTPASSWNDLGWNNVPVVNKHVTLGSPLTGFAGGPAFTPTWPPATSAVLAAMTLQGPFRAAIHLSDLLGTGQS